jgi:hypothetical protein
MRRPRWLPVPGSERRCDRRWYRTTARVQQGRPPPPEDWFVEATYGRTEPERRRRDVLASRSRRQSASRLPGLAAASAALRHPWNVDGQTFRRAAAERFANFIRVWNRLSLLPEPAQADDRGGDQRASDSTRPPAERPAAGLGVPAARRRTGMGPRSGRRSRQQNGRWRGWGLRRSEENGDEAATASH